MEWQWPPSRRPAQVITRVASPSSAVTGLYARLFSTASVITANEPPLIRNTVSLHIPRFGRRDTDHTPLGTARAEKCAAGRTGIRRAARMAQGGLSQVAAGAADQSEPGSGRSSAAGAPPSDAALYYRPPAPYCMPRASGWPAGTGACCTHAPFAGQAPPSPRGPRRRLPSPAAALAIPPG